MSFGTINIPLEGVTTAEKNAYLYGDRDFDAEKAYNLEVKNAQRYIHGVPMEYPKPEVKDTEDQKLVEQFLANPNLVIQIIKGTHPDGDVTHYTRG